MIARPVAIRIHPDDNVAVAIRPLAPGERIEVADARVDTLDAVPAGHKVALRPLDVGDLVVKYGFPIGRITAPVSAGAWIHSHNLQTRLEGMQEYVYSPNGTSARARGAMPTFQG